MHSVQRKQSNYILHYKSRIPQLCQMSDKFGKIHSKKLSFTQFVTRTILLVKATPQSLVALPSVSPFQFHPILLAAPVFTVFRYFDFGSYVVRQISFDQRTVHHMYR